MSWRVANECADRRFGSAARKQIIMFLADKASDDGSGIWCSKGTIQRHTELGESTVKRTISVFLKEGILIETGRRPCKNGFTVLYRIVLARVMVLESTVEPDDGTGGTVNSVQPEPGTGSTVDGYGVHGGPQTTLKPSINHLRASARRWRQWRMPSSSVTAWAKTRWISSPIMRIATSFCLQGGSRRSRGAYRSVL
jgi:hypothetical protein